MSISLTTRVEEEAVVVLVSGEIDIYTAPKLREQLAYLVNEGAQHVVVDLSAVTFLDSSALGVLVGTLKRLREQKGRLSLVAPQDSVLKVFRITGLDKAFPIFTDVATAVSAADELRPEGLLDL